MGKVWVEAERTQKGVQGPINGGSQFLVRVIAILNLIT
jgi:hypothetical protein